jgi:hypothetical protein
VVESDPGREGPAFRSWSDAGDTPQDIVGGGAAPAPTVKREQTDSDVWADEENSLAASAQSSFNQVEALAVSAGRFGLACQAARSGDNTQRAGALAAMALSEELQTGTGSVASALLPHLVALGGYEFDDRAISALSLAVALRAAMFVPASETLELIGSLRAVWAHHPGTALLLDVTQQARSLSSVLRPAVKISSECRW